MTPCMNILTAMLQDPDLPDDPAPPESYRWDTFELILAGVTLLAGAAAAIIFGTALL